MKVWVLTGDKMETAAATCYASKLFHRNTQILELTTKRTEEQSLHDVLFDLSRTVLRQHGGMTRDTFSRYALGSVFFLTWLPADRQVELTAFLFWGNQPIGRLHRLWPDHRWGHPLCRDEAGAGGLQFGELQRNLP